MIGTSGANRERARCDGGVSSHCLGLGVGAIPCQYQGHRRRRVRTYVEEFHPGYHRFSKPLIATAAPTKADKAKKAFIIEASHK